MTDLRFIDHEEDGEVLTLSDGSRWRSGDMSITEIWLPTNHIEMQQDGDNITLVNLSNSTQVAVTRT